jgi:hypothetical protein
VASLLPPPGSDDAPRGKFGLHEPGVLEQMATSAGLTPKRAGDLVSTLEFDDDATLVRQLLSPGSMTLAAQTAGEQRVRSAILDSLARFRTPSGDYRLRNEWRYLIASA